MDHADCGPHRTRFDDFNLGGLIDVPLLARQADIPGGTGVLLGGFSRLLGGVLEGLRVLELGQLLAGPFAGHLVALVKDETRVRVIAR